MNIIFHAIKKSPAALITFLLVMAFETLYLLTTEPLTGHPWKEPTADDAVVAAKYGLAKLDLHYDVAFVGDSSCLRGVVPEQFKQVTGLAAVNLCTHKMHSIAGYSLMAARVAKEHPELKAVVVVVMPETLGSRESLVDDYGAVGKQLFAYGDEGLGFSSTLSGFRHWFLARHAWQDFPQQFGGSYTRLVELLEESNGYLPENAAQPMVNYPAEREFKLASWQFEWIARLNRQFQGSGLKILVALSPIAASASSPSFLQSAEQALNRLADMYSNVEIIRPRPPEYPPSAFASPAHMLPQWAQKNTLDLAPRVVAALD